MYSVQLVLELTMYDYVFRQTIMEDEFIKEHIEELLRNIRQQVLVKVIRPYTKVRIQFLSEVSINKECMVASDLQ